MLNCTDLACVLHHHHFYAHLHHIRHHLQDDNENTESGNGSDIDNNDSEFFNPDDASLSHVDAPNEVIYMVCGVFIAMILVGLIIVLVAVTINKLRKREETSAVSPSGHHVEAQLNYNNINSHNNNSNNIHHIQVQNHQPQNNHQQQPSIVLTVDQDLQNHCTTTTLHNGTIQLQQQHQQQHQQQQQQPIAFRQSPQSVWVFPPLPPQPNIYCVNNHDALAHLNDKGGFKGFRKQFSGRFKRLVAKKSQEPPPIIPPELKPQLKTIYVY